MARSLDLAIRNVPYVALDALLEVVRTSHRGQHFNMPKIFGDSSAGDDITSMYPDAEKSGTLPRIPDIRKRRSDFDIAQYELRKGDVLVLHPGSLHGGGQVDADFPDRHTLVLRFFGDKCRYEPLPTVEAAKAFDDVKEGSEKQKFVGRYGKSEMFEGIKNGEPFALTRNGQWTLCLGPGIPGATAKL